MLSIRIQSLLLARLLIGVLGILLAVFAASSLAVLLGRLEVSVHSCAHLLL